MVKNLKRYRKQIEREQGKLEAQKYLLKTSFPQLVFYYTY